MNKKVREKKNILMIHCMGLLLYPVPPGFLQYLQLLQPKMYRFVGCFFKCCEDFFFLNFA